MTKKRWKWQKICTLDYLKCIGLTSRGQGIVLIDEKEFYVDHLIPGEEARIEVYYQQNSYGKAKAKMIRNPSEKRALQPYDHKLKYGTYHLAHLKDQYQDEFKEEQVKKLFPNFQFKLLVGKRTNYRNKVVLNSGCLSGLNPRHKLIPSHFDLMDFDYQQYFHTKGDVIIRKLDTTIVGKPGEQKVARHQMLGFNFLVNLNSFYQVNSEMAELAYKQIIEYVPEGSVVFDLFSGAGVIGIHVSKKAKEVYCVEILESSHNDGIANLKENNINNVHLILGDANDFVKTSQIKPDVIIIDPSRAGFARESMEIINESNAKLIIYLSCNIETQARDCKYLTNYEMILVQPYDFFPQTYHVENLVVLKKKS